MISIAAVVSVLLYLCNFVIFWRFNLIGQKMNLDESHAFYVFVQEQLKMMNTAYIFISLGVFSFLVLSGLFISHRISGPLYNLKMNIRRLSELKGLEGITEIKEIKFRKSDFFHDLSKEINIHITHLQEEYDRLCQIDQELKIKGIQAQFKGNKLEMVNEASDPKLNKAA